MLKNIKEYIIKTLRSMEKYTKTDMLYVAKGGFWLGIGQFVASGSAFIMSVAFANLISPESYGLYKFVLSINSLLVITTLSGMDSAVTQAVSRGYEGTMNLGFKEKMKWGVLGSIISFGITIYYFTQGNYILTLCFGVISIFIPFTESSDIYNSLLWGKKLFNIQAKYNIINTLIVLTATTTTLLLTKNIYVILAVYLLAMTIPNFFFISKVKNFYQENNNIDKESLQYGKHLSLIGIISLVTSQIDKILIFHYIGATNLAIYSIAVAPTDQVKGLLKNLNSLAMPRFSQRSSEEIKKNIWHKVGLLTIFISLVVICYIFLLPFIFKIFFPKYLSSIVYSQILSLSLIPVVIAGFLYTVLESKKDENSIYKYNLYGNLFSLIILFPLIYFFGIRGAIASRIISRVFYFGLASKLINKMN